jgi:hypothetical protein
MASFWKKITLRKKIVSFLLCLIFLFFVIWLALPNLVEWELKSQSEDFGFSGFEVDVEQVDPWLSRLTGLRMEKEESLSLGIDHADVFYSPGSLAEGKIDAISLTGLSLELSGDSPLLSSSESKETETESLEATLAPFLEQPSLTHLRVRDSVLSLTKNGTRYPVEFLLQGDFYPELIRLVFDGSFLGCLFESHFNLEQNESGTFATARMKIPDMAKLQPPLEKVSSAEGFAPDGFSLLGGELKLSASGKVKENSLTDLFLELNASDLALDLFGHEANASKIFCFLAPESMDMTNWQAKAYANADIRDWCRLFGVELGLRAKGEQFELSGRLNKVWTQGDLPKIEVSNLRFPSFDFTLQELIAGGSTLPASMIGQKKEFFYDKISFEDDLIFLNEGSASILFPEEGTRVLLTIPPSDATFEEIGFVNFSYSGLLDWEEFPRISFPQVVSGERIMFGFESAVENLAFTFRVESLERILMDALSFDASGLTFDLNPAKMLIELPEDSPETPRMVFKGSTLRIPIQDIVIEGIEGVVAIESFEPLSTKGTQTISFDRISVGDLEIVDGNFSFRVNPDETVVIEIARGRMWGGEVGLRKSAFQLYRDGFRINTRITGVDGQKVADLLAVQDVRVDGNFSGDITFSNEEGQWDFSNGLVMLDPSPGAWLSSKSNSALLKGLKKGTSEYERMKMTEEAMRDLKLESMRILFKALDGKREIVVSILGKSDSGRRIISLDNNVNFIAGLPEIIRAYFDLGKLGIDPSSFGFGLTAFEID